MEEAFLLKIPSGLNHRSVLKVIRDLNNFILLDKINNLVIDFTDTNFISPGGLTPLLAYLLEIKSSLVSGTIISSANSNVENYINRMGFYDLLGIEADYNFQKKDGIGFFQELYRFSSETNEAEVQFIQENVIKIFTRLQNNNNYINALRWCIPELVDNAYTHSNSSICVLFAQRYSKRTEFCISDRGVGIRETMGCSDILDALGRCVQKEKGIYSQGQGKGLFHTSNLIMNDNSEKKSILNIHSENGIITFVSGRKEPQLKKTTSFWQGTTVTLSLYDEIKFDISNLLGHTPYGAEDLPNFYDIF